MAEITTRSSNRAELTHKQVDANFINLNNAVMKAQLTADEASAKSNLTPSLKEISGRVRVAPNSENDNGVQAFQVYGSAVVTEAMAIGGQPGAESLRVLASTPVTGVGGRIDISGGISSLFPKIQVTHPLMPDCNLNFGAQGSGGFRFFSQGVGINEQMRISHTASAISYANITGGAGTFPVTYSAGGSSAAISISIAAKGNAAILLQGNGFTQFSAGGGVSVISNIHASGGSSATPPSLSVIGAATDADLRLQAKGAGRVRFGTYTAAANLPIVGYITIKDDSGVDRRIAVV